MTNKNTHIKLDTRLENDCHVLGQLQDNLLLLNKNALFAWFILVPKTGQTEFYQLPDSQQLEIVQHINLLSSFIKQEFNSDKLNIATIGNIVSQLHIHIVGRHKKDACWPGVVWGFNESKDYMASELEALRDKLSRTFTTDFTTGTA